MTGRRLDDAVILEVGYGANPITMLWLRSHGLRVWGVDLDQPVLRGSIGEFARVYRKNGVQRLLKSVARHYLFDRKEWHGLDKELRARGLAGLSLEADRFLVGDAATVELPESLGREGCDFVYSAHVFEHIPEQALDRVLGRVAGLIRPEGCAFLQAEVFTGLSGGHLPEWYRGQIRARGPAGECRSEPWEHLRKKRFTANTYLNELRLADYRRLISKHLTIVSEENPDLELFGPFLCPAIREELAEYSEEELLAGAVIWMCRAPAQA